MATRTSFRPRPLDLSKPLPIVRDVRDLDNAEALVSRDVTHNHETLDKENEQVRGGASPAHRRLRHALFADLHARHRLCG
jgi:hypothetical protein